MNQELETLLKHKKMLEDRLGAIKSSQSKDKDNEKWENKRKDMEEQIKAVDKQIDGAKKKLQGQVDELNKGIDQPHVKTIDASKHDTPIPPSQDPTK